MRISSKEPYQMYFDKEQFFDPHTYETSSSVARCSKHTLYLLLSEPPADQNMTRTWCCIIRYLQYPITSQPSSNIYFSSLCEKLLRSCSTAMNGHLWRNSHPNNAYGSPQIEVNFEFHVFRIWFHCHHTLLPLVAYLWCNKPVSRHGSTSPTYWHPLWILDILYFQGRRLWGTQRSSLCKCRHLPSIMNCDIDRQIHGSYIS